MVRSRATDTPSLVAAAAVVFEQKGFRNATIDDVAEAAGVARATLYKYVDSKQHLLDMIVEAVQDEMAAGLDAALRSEGTPRERLRRFVEAHATAFLENRVFYGIVYTEEKELSDRGRKAFRVWARSRTDDFTELVQQYLDSRDAGPAVDAAFVSNAILSMLATLHRWYQPDGTVGHQQLADHLFPLVDGALSGASQGTETTAT
jgi:AcrR family transcriptional regulator